jgi:hypothetical protein
MKTNTKKNTKKAGRNKKAIRKREIRLLTAGVIQCGSLVCD